MSERSDKLALRRHALSLKIAAQRQILGLQIAELDPKSYFTNDWMSWLVNARLTRLGLLSAAAIAACYLLKPKQVWMLVRQGLRIWQIWQILKPYFQAEHSYGDTKPTTPPPTSA